MVSLFVKENLCIINFLCKLSTSRKTVVHIINSAKVAFVKAIAELNLNCKDPGKNKRQGILASSKISLRRKKAYILKIWKTLRVEIGEVVRELHEKQHEAKNAEARNP